MLPGDPDYDVIIIGAGPAGLAAATELRRRNIARIVVLEREAEAGGIPRHCSHPPFGIREYGRLMTGPVYARRNVVRAQQSGVEIRTRTAAVALAKNGRVAITSPAGVSEITGRRILLCLGARESPGSARLIGGTRPIGVVNTGALQVSVNLQHLLPFTRPLIVGTELVSLSSILTCRHAGIRPVAMIEAAAAPVARWPLNLLPRLAGIPLHLQTELVAIEGQGRVASATVRHAGGRLCRVACDGVLLTGGFTPESALARKAGVAIDPGTGGPRVDPFGRCSEKTVFAAGNLLRPVESAGWCWREGVRIGALVARDLTEGLPDADAAITLHLQAPLRYAMPQALLAGLREVTQLQLRVSRPIRATLTASQSGTRLAQHRAEFRPERRILLTLPAQLTASAPIEIRMEDEK
jgi:NADPH-dependent 2,4-dienoyl-CoA reductase/sulfur reductase-like enzyme